MTSSLSLRINLMGPWYLQTNGRLWCLQTYKDMKTLVPADVQRHEHLGTQQHKVIKTLVPTAINTMQKCTHNDSFHYSHQTKRTCTHCHAPTRIPICIWQARKATQTYFISWSAMLRFMYLRRAITTSPSVDTHTKWLQVTENYHGLKNNNNKNRKDKKKQTQWQQVNGGKKEETDHGLRRTKTLQ